MVTIGLASIPSRSTKQFTNLWNNQLGIDL